jgi:hypothetical protein
MRTLEVLVEDQSTEQALKAILAKIIAGRAKYAIRNFNSKPKLLHLLPDRLAGYKERIGSGEDLRILVLVDCDDDSCTSLKDHMEAIATSQGLITKTQAARSQVFHVVNRIAIEELEAWFLGDPLALREAFSSLPPINHRAGIFRNPDNVSGGSWEALHRFLKRHGVYRNSYPKIEAAQRIGAKMEPSRNQSRSFAVFVEGLEALLA